MNAIPVDDGQFQIPIKRGGRYWLPHRFILGRNGQSVLDAGQIQRPGILPAGHVNAFQTAITSRVSGSWAATFRKVCHFIISLLCRSGTFDRVSPALGVRRAGELSVAKLTSPRSKRRSASDDINGAMSDIAKFGLILTGFHLASRSGPALA